MKCPQCKTKGRQNKDGFTNAGSQRFRCKACGARHTPVRNEAGYEPALRSLTIRMYADGLNFRQIGRHLEVSHASVMNWIKGHAAQLPAAPVPQEVYTVEMGELNTFIEPTTNGIFWHNRDRRFPMKRKRFTEQQIIKILNEAEAGVTLAELGRQYGFSQSAFYKWKAQYGGMGVSQLQRLKELEEENRKLKQMYADLSLEHKVLKDIVEKKL